MDLPSDRPRDDARPVFVTADGRPRRRLRLLGLAMTGATSAWILGIVVGAYGYLGLPALGPIASHRWEHPQSRTALATQPVQRPRLHAAQLRTAELRTTALRGGRASERGD